MTAFFLATIVVLHPFIRIAQLASYALAIGDCMTTIGAIAAGAREGNPIIAFVMRLVGSRWVLVRLNFGLFSITSSLYGASDTPLTLLVVLLLDAGLAWVVWHNWTLWQSKRRGG